MYTNNKLLWPHYLHSHELVASLNPSVKTFTPLPPVTYSKSETALCPKPKLFKL